MQGAVIAHKEARKLTAVQALLLEYSTPHTLYALANARLGTEFTRRAFSALATHDADRALRLIENAKKGVMIHAEPDDRTPILEHPDRMIRSRAMTLMRESSALRLSR